MIISNIALEAIGGSIGAIIRFLISELFKYFNNSYAPLSTLIINVTGSFLIGLLFGWLSTCSYAHETKNSLMLFIMTGILGGFTTFSTFSLDFLKYIMNGNYIIGFSYIIASIVFGLIMVFAGYKLTS